MKEQNEENDENVLNEAYVKNITYEKQTPE